MGSNVCTSWFGGNIAAGSVLHSPTGIESENEGEKAMTRMLRGIVCVAAAAAALAGCASLGRGHGPVEAFAFLAAANPQVPRGAVGAIDEATEPKEIQVVVPPGTDMRGLVATLSL